MASRLDLQALLRNLPERLEQLSLRERGILTGVLAAATVLAFVELAWIPDLQTLRQAEQETDTLLERAGILTSTRVELDHHLRKDPDAPLRIQNSQLQAQLAAQEEELFNQVGRLVKPEQVVDLLRHVLHEQGELKVTRLRTLPVEPMFDLQAGDESDPGARALIDPLYHHLYSHRVQVELEAGYFSLLEYLQRLEGLEAGLLLNRLAYRVDSYPRASVTLVVETISLDKEWLGV